MKSAMICHEDRQRSPTRYDGLRSASHSVLGKGQGKEPTLIAENILILLVEVQWNALLLYGSLEPLGLVKADKVVSAEELLHRIVAMLTRSAR
jgi:hypothetical protein